MQKENCENLLMALRIIAKVEDIKEDLLFNFNEEKLTEEQKQYVLMSLDYANLVCRALNLVKIHD